MSLPRPHPILPATGHDDTARFAFINDLRGMLETRVAPALAAQAEAYAAGAPGYDPQVLRSAWQSFRGNPLFQDWSCLLRSAQEQMWEVAGTVADANRSATAEAVRQHGGNRVDVEPGFVPPRYLQALDTHCMPGSYARSDDADDVRQGVVFDLAASIYHMGRNGGALNDLRGHTIVQHLFERFPDADIRHIVEMGCTVGHSTVAIASYFPAADYVAVDVGAGILRYAAARAASLGASVRFVQANAEATGLAAGEADLVCSAVMLHETSNAAVRNIMAESYRLLKPGGIAIHLEVPLAYARASLWKQIRGEFECFFNNEPYWRGCNTADLAGLMAGAGFADVADGYQNTVAKADRAGPPGFGPDQGEVFACWRIISGRKPAP
jgi:SAM-dependent methyltransferase